MDDMIALNITIADRTYRLKSRAEDEEKIRKTAKLINDKIKEFKTVFGGKDMQDYISMVLLWLAVEGAPSTSANNNGGETEEALQRMEALLDKALAGL